MKKSLLIAVAALFVAIGVNAQSKRVPLANKVIPHAAPMQMKKASVPQAQSLVATRTKAATTRRAVGDIAGNYILDYGNWDGDFTTSCIFTITAASGTTTVIGTDEAGNDVEQSFEYNIRLDNFTLEGGVAYGYYDEELAEILVPVQTLTTLQSYGRVVFSGMVTQNGSPYNFGFDMLFEVGPDGNLYNYDFADELAAAGWGEGCAITGFYDYLPDYGSGMSYVALGTSADIYAVNGGMYDIERHVSNNAWTSWAEATREVYVEDYGEEVVVHNFLGLCPISITVEGNKASIATPVRVMEDDYAEDEGSDPDYIRIWQWDEDFESVVVPGAITGTISDVDGWRYIEFYETEYKEDGPDGPGDYYINDYTKWFMVHSLYGENGAYWWGEARFLYVVYPIEGDPSGIKNVNGNVNGNTAKTFNMLGQEVGKGAKGLLIRDGKKFVVK